MMNRNAKWLWLLVFGLGLFLSACGSQVATPAQPNATVTPIQVVTQVVVAPNPTAFVIIQPPATPTPVGISDPFAYCTVAVNADTPGAPYSGAKNPESVVKGLIKAAKMAPDIPLEVATNLTLWRCMDKQVWACTVGANLPCGEKADTSRTPAQAVSDYCKTNRNASVIPAVVTGRATVYEWRCSNGAPQIVKELFKPDARGFISAFWYQIPQAQ